MSGKGQCVTGAMLPLPHSPLGGVSACLPHLDVLGPGSALPQGVGSHIGPTIQPRWPLWGVTAGCLRMQHCFGCTTAALPCPL